MRLLLSAALVVCCWSCCGTRRAESHPVSVTRTFVFVSRARATARIEIFLEDLFLFHDLKPNEADFLEPATIRRGIEQHKQFVAERFTIRDAAGERCRPQSVQLNEFLIPAGGVPLAELMAHRLTFELEYALDASPEYLTFSQRFTDEEAFLPSEMSLQVKQENAGMPYSAPLVPDRPVTVRFNWENPPLSAEASDAQWEEWFAAQQEATLGITSYSSVYSFLYIEDHEVRHEILIPLLTLEESVAVERDGDAFLDLAEQDAARARIEAFFRTGNPIVIDGVQRAPVVERCDFYGVDFKDFAQQAPRKRVSTVSARVGVILAYRIEGPPRTVHLTWTRFNKYVWSVSTAVFAYDTALTTTLSRVGSRNEFSWKNPGRPAPPPIEQVEAALPPPPTRAVPVLSLGCLMLVPAVLWAGKRRRASMRRRCSAVIALAAVAAMAWPRARWEMPDPFWRGHQVSSREADAVFAALHENVYGAFRFRDERALHDALSVSLHRDLLTDVYLQVRRGLVMQEQGGAVSRVRDVKILSGDVEPLARPRARRSPGQTGFGYRCRWQVVGTVEHWGHIHQRTNQYDARFAIEPVDGVWKVTGMDVLDEQRVRFETRLRGR